MDVRKTVLDTIKQVRSGQPFLVSENNQNIYRVVLEELSGEKTAYYFNSPLYRRRDGFLIDKRFISQSGSDIFLGSSAQIVHSNGDLRMVDHLGELSIHFTRKEPLHNTFGILRGQTIAVHPTLNGIAIEANCEGGAPFRFGFHTTEKFEKIKKNTKYVAFMRNKFEPFFVISPLYARISGTDTLVPCTVNTAAKEDGTYIAAVRAATDKPHTITFEINIYEGKFFQDTTVESQFPDRNNCYGSVSFLGQTFELGEQWLYTKTSRKKVYDIENIPISSVRMFIPVFKKGNILPTAYLPLERFCSFGSTWKKKIPFTNMLTTAQYAEQFYILDLSELLINPTTHLLRKSEGIILRLLGEGDDCAVIATGDCCAAPQFLEIKYH